MLGPSSGPVAGRLSAVETDKSLVRLTTSKTAVNASHIDAEIYFAELRLFHVFLMTNEIPPMESRYTIKPDIRGAAALTHG